MNNALLYLGGLLIAALAALFAVPHFVDWNSYRGLFEEEASRILGREVRVGGAVNVRFLPVPYVRFEKIRIADAETAASGSIIRVDSFTMWLAVPPLLRGVLEAHQVELRRPIVQLATDASGSGNWRTLSLNPGSMPFVPNGVALQSVRVTDGAIILSGPVQGELARFDAINGELAAEALDGPFKFKGTLAWSGSARQVRVATAKYDANGDLRFKASVEAPQTGNSYVLDGRLSELDGKPKLDGDLTAKLKFSPKAAGEAGANAEPKALGPLDTSPPATEPGVAPPPSKNGPAPFELKAKVAGDTSGAKLSELTVSLEHEGAPQIITGSAKLDWSNKLRLDVNLSSKWLDLDRLAGGTENATKIPLEAARSYFGALAAILPQEADTNAELEFDQLTLGGEPIGNVRLAASRSNGPLELKGVRATLPGGARLLLDGVLQPGGTMPKLDGTLFITGQSLLRFLAWGFRDTDIAAGRTDGPFALDGHFELSQADIALTEATAEWSGTALHGGIKLGLGERKKVALTLEGSRVDAAQIHSGLVGLASLKGLMSGLALESLAGPAIAFPTTDTSPTAEPIASKITGANTDISLRLKIAELTDGRRVLRDFDAELAIEKGALSFPALKFSTPDGLIVEAEGEATDIVSRPRGAIRALISAPTVPAARTLMRLLDLPESEKSFADRVASLAPLRVAGILGFHGERGHGERGAASELNLDGSLAGGRLTARMNLDGGYQHWRTAPIDLGLTMNGIDAGHVLGALFDVPAASVASVSANTSTDGGSEKGSVGPAVNSGQLVLKAVGTPASGLVSLAQLTGDGVLLDYRGRVTLPEDAAVTVLGDVRATARDSRRLLALAGVPIAAGAADVPLSGTLSVALKDATLRLESGDLTLGGGALKGVVSVDTGTNGKPVFTADLDVASASMSSLLSPILARATAPVEAEPAAPERPARGGVASVPPAAPIWPDQPFDLALLDRVGGTVKLKIGTFSIEPGLAISDATLEATLSERGIRVGNLTGKALGGRLASQLDFEKAAAGAGLKGELRIDVASKPDAAVGTPGDVAAFSIDFSGRALSPAALISALDGKGEVSVGNAAISGMSPAAVSTVIEAGLAGKGPVGGEPLVEAIKTGLRQGELKLGKVAIPLKIHDGALRLEKVRIEQADGRSTFETTIELATMKLDSEWQIEAKLARATGPAERAYLPPVSVVYTGKLAEYGVLEPTVSVAALERELAVRKLERDVEHLEQLRKADQARAAQDRERRRLLEAERNAAGAATNNNGSTTAPPPGATSPSTNAPVPPGGPQQPPAPSAQPQSGAAVTPGSATTTATTATPQGAAAGANAADPASAAAQTSAPATSAPEVAGADEQRPSRRRKPPQENGWQPFLTPF
ncbi:MAG: AsmA family protein [Hyphomicrobium sp.]|jgi:uncharacterized protein involved in outer membrane biogenesis